MSKYSKKLLITGGCSWTSPIEPYYKEAGMDKVWPDHVAEFFDWDLVNTGMGGASNEYIQGRVLDAIELNQDRDIRSEEHTSELQSRLHVVCRLLLETKDGFILI